MDHLLYHFPRGKQEGLFAAQQILKATYYTIWKVQGKNRVQNL